MQDAEARHLVTDGQRRRTEKTIILKLIGLLRKLVEEGLANFKIFTIIIICSVRFSVRTAQNTAEILL